MQIPTEQTHFSFKNSTGMFPREILEELLVALPEITIRAALEAGDIHPRNEWRVREWLAEQQRELDAVEQAANEAHRQRELGAAERAAVAAEKSARWAGFAVAISVAALFVAAWPYLPFNK